MTDDPIVVWVDQTEYSGGTVALGHGATPAGDRVSFVGEPRALRAISEALVRGDGPVLTGVQPRDVIRRAPR